MKLNKLKDTRTEILAELWAQCKAKRMGIALDYKHGSYKIDAVIYNKYKIIKAIVEVRKSQRTDNFLSSEIPTLNLYSISQVPYIVNKLQSLLRLNLKKIPNDMETEKVLQIKFHRGKHAGKTIEKILEDDPGYILWGAKNLEEVPYTKSIIDAAQAAMSN